MGMCAFISVVPFAKRVEHQNHEHPYQVNSGQPKTQVRRAKQEYVIWRNDIIRAVTGSVKQDHHQGMNNIEMYDIIKHGNPAVYVHNPGKPILCFFNSGQQE
jgi:hypothetical protein